MAQLRVRKTIIDTLAFPLSRFGAILPRAAIPLLMAAIASVGFNLWVVGQLVGEDTKLADLIWLPRLREAYELTYWPLWIISLVAIVRCELLGEAPNLGWFHFRLSRYELYCLGGLVLLLAPIFLIVAGLFLGIAQLQILLAISPIPWPVAAPILIVLLVLVSLAMRLSLLPTMGALGLLPDPRRAWRLTTGCARGFLLLTFCAAALSAAAMAALGFVFNFLIRALSGDNVFAAVVGKEALYLVPLVLLIHLLCLGFVAGFLTSLYRQVGTPLPDIAEGRPSAAAAR